MQSMHSSMYLEMINIEREEVIARGLEKHAMAQQKQGQSRFHAVRNLMSRVLIGAGERIRPGELSPLATELCDDSEWMSLAQ